VLRGDPPRVVVFIDEIEEAFAGTGTDLSGVKTEMTGTILTYMQDREADGAVFIGPPGAAKSAAAKATGGTAGIPTIRSRGQPDADSGSSAQERKWRKSG